MFKKYKSLLDTFLYSFGDILNKGVAFLVVPIFTRMLSQEDYGALSLFQTYYAIFIILFGLNIPGGITQTLYEDINTKRSYFLVNFKFLVLFSAVLTLLGVILNYFNLLSFLGINTNIIYFCLVNTFLGVMVNFYQSIQLGKRQSKQYVTNSILIITGGLIISLVLMTTLFKNAPLYGRLTGRLIVPIGFMFFTFATYFDAIKIGFKKNWKDVKHSLDFSVPLIPHVLSFLIIGQFDRLIINKYNGLGDTGIYSLAYTIASVFPILLAAINKSWIPIFQKHLREHDYSLIESKVVIIANVFLFLVTICILFADLIFKIFAPESYDKGIIIFQMLLIGVYFNYIYNNYVNYSYFKRVTGRISSITIFIGFFSVIGNLFLIKYFGMKGAAANAIFSSIILLSVHHFNAKQLTGVNIIRFGVFIKPIIIIGLIGILTFFIDYTIWNTILRLALKTLILIILTYTLFYNDIDKIKRLLLNTVEKKQ